MQWNDLDFEMQRQVLDKIGNLMLEEVDEHLQFAIAAGIVELELWSNTPCKILGDFEGSEENLTDDLIERQWYIE